MTDCRVAVVLGATLALAACSAQPPEPPASAATSVSPSRGVATQAPGDDEVGDSERLLLAAAYDNDLAAARRLIGAGADVNATDGSRQSAYLIATSEVGDDPRLLELTLAGGADVQAKDSYNGTGLIRAAERGYPRIVARLLAAGIDRDHVNRLGWTALLEAVILGEGGPEHVETVRLLLAGGADADLPDADGVTPLAHAQRREQREVVALLVAAGARP